MTTIARTFAPAWPNVAPGQFVWVRITGTTTYRAAKLLPSGPLGQIYVQFIEQDAALGVLAVSAGELYRDAF